MDFLELTHFVKPSEIGGFEYLEVEENPLIECLKWRLLETFSLGGGFSHNFELHPKLLLSLFNLNSTLCGLTAK